MSLLAAPQLHKLIDSGVIDALHENVNSASIDVRIGNEIMVEEPSPVWDGQSRTNHEPIDISAKQSPRFKKVTIPEEGIVIEPGQCFLAHTVETFNLPDTISGQFIERSTVARCFLEHMQAGWADAGWHGAQLTLEFKNMNQYHRLLIKPGMRIGQMVFFEHVDVGSDSYSVKGNYNNQKGATAAYSGEGHKTKLLKFYSDTCGPCKTMAPIVENVLSNEFKGVELVEMNLKDAPAMDKARELGLRAVPSFVVEKEGEIVAKHTGMMTREELVKFIKGE